MSEPTVKAIRSPSYPSMSLKDAVDAVAKIERQYRSATVDRGNASKLIGYSGPSGPANSALASMAAYGLLERAGKGEARVTQRARAILHASNDAERVENLLAAASEPDLYRELRERFDGIAVPPEDGVITYLNRQGFNPTAIKPAARAFLQTMEFVKEINGNESHGNEKPKGPESLNPDPDESRNKVFGGAKVGDFIQWESQGALQFSHPLRVRHVTPDGQFVAVEGSETGIPMNEVLIETRAPVIPPALPFIPFTPAKTNEPEEGFEEWFRAKVGAGKQIQILYRGADDLGPKEIQKLIDILTAQKAALDD